MPREDENEAPYEVRLSEPAEAEVDAIYLGRIRFGERSAQQWHKRLLRSLETLALFPYAYPPAPGSRERGDDARQMIFGTSPDTYRVIYRVLEPEGKTQVLSALSTFNGGRGSSPMRQAASVTSSRFPSVRTVNQGL